MPSKITCDNRRPSLRILILILRSIRSKKMNLIMHQPSRRIVETWLSISSSEMSTDRILKCMWHFSKTLINVSTSLIGPRRWNTILFIYFGLRVSSNPVSYPLDCADAAIALNMGAERILLDEFPVNSHFYTVWLSRSASTNICPPTFRYVFSYLCLEQQTLVLQRPKTNLIGSYLDSSKVHVQRTLLVILPPNLPLLGDGTIHRELKL